MKQNKLKIRNRRQTISRKVFVIVPAHARARKMLTLLVNSARLARPHGNVRCRLSRWPGCRHSDETAPNWTHTITPLSRSAIFSRNGRHTLDGHARRSEPHGASAMRHQKTEHASQARRFNSVSPRLYEKNRHTNAKARSLRIRQRGGTRIPTIRSREVVDSRNGNSRFNESGRLPEK